VLVVKLVDVRALFVGCFGRLDDFDAAEGCGRCGVLVVAV